MSRRRLHSARASTRASCASCETRHTPRQRGPGRGASGTGWALSLSSVEEDASNKKGNRGPCAPGGETRPSAGAQTGEGGGGLLQGRWWRVDRAQDGRSYHSVWQARRNAVRAEGWRGGVSAHAQARQRGGARFGVLCDAEALAAVRAARGQQTQTQTQTQTQQRLSGPLKRRRTGLNAAGR